MVLGDRDYGDSEEFTCKSLVGTNLATEHHVLLIKLLKDPLERPFSVGNHKFLDISFVTVFQKGLQSPSFVIGTWDITSAVETTCT
jgi:hypothetical protein